MKRNVDITYIQRSNQSPPYRPIKSIDLNNSSNSVLSFESINSTEDISSGLSFVQLSINFSRSPNPIPILPTNFLALMKPRNFSTNRRKREKRRRRRRRKEKCS